MWIHDTTSLDLCGISEALVESVTPALVHSMACVCLMAAFAGLQEHRSTFYLPYWNIPFSDVVVPRLRDFKANMAILDQQLDELIRLAINTKQEDDIESLQARLFFCFSSMMLHCLCMTAPI